MKTHEFLSSIRAEASCKLRLIKAEGLEIEIFGIIK